MATEFKLPDLGDGVDSIDVVSVLVKEGDEIEKDQPVFEAETDKAVVEVPSSVAGVVEKINIKKGETLKAGHVVLTVRKEDSEDEAKSEKKKSKKKSKPKKKAEAEKPEKSEGTNKAVKEKSDSKSRVESRPDAPKTDLEQTPESPKRDHPPLAAAPTVRKFAREIGVDINLVVDTDGDGRITIEDVKKTARDRGISTPTSTAPADSGPVTEPLSKLRKTAAAHLSKCWREIPHVTLHDKADVTDLEEFRLQHKKRALKEGGRLTITPIFMKIVAAALKAHPVCNASIDMEKQTVTYHKEFDIGIAVDTDRGLVVPAVRDVNRKSIMELAVELDALGEKARAGKLTKEEMSGATFTITNLGSIGVGFFTPIVSAPQVCILGIGRSVREPVWDDEHEQFEARLMCPLSLSFDHRLVDGADAARYLRFIVDAVTNPMMLVLQ